MASKIVSARVSAGMVFAYKQKDRLGILTPEKDIIWIFYKKNAALFFKEWDSGEKVWIKFSDEHSRTNPIITALMPQSMCPDPDSLGGEDEIEINIDIPKIVRKDLNYMDKYDKK